VYPAKRTKSVELQFKIKSASVNQFEPSIRNKAASGCRDRLADRCDQRDGFER
jgi:hypothetical protein